MKDKARATIKRYQMLPSGTRVVAAVSGGADSTALLHLLCGMREEYGLALEAAHVNHGLRAQESDRDEQAVRVLCGGLGVPLHVARLDGLVQEARRKGKSVEEHARDLRYQWLEQVAGREGRIATAHSLDDCAETTLFHLARGTGLRGLLGIPPVRGNIIRPLIRCTRAQIESYCRENGLSWVTDSSNLSDCYSRNRIRHQVVPALRQVHPGFERSYGRMLEHLTQDEDYLEGQAKAALPALCFDNGWKGIPALHPALQYRVLSLLLRRAGASYDARKAGLLLEHLAQGDPFTLELCKGRFAKTEGGILRLYESLAPPPYFEIPVREGVFPVNNTISVSFCRINYEQYKQFEKSDGKVLKNGINCDRIDGDLVLRQKKDGDRIRLWRTGRTKTLKKMFQEAGLTQWERKNTPVLADRKGPLWVWGFGVDERAAVDKAAKEILLVQVEELSQ